MCSLNLQYVCTSDNLFSISLALVVVVVVKICAQKIFVTTSKYVQNQALQMCTFVELAIIRIRIVDVGDN